MISPYQSRHRGTPAWTVLLAALLLLAGGAHGRAATRQMLRGHVPAVVARLKPIGRLPAAQHLRLAISLPLRNEAEMAEMLKEMYDPASPRYRHYLTTAQFAAEFGPAEGDYEKVAAFARAHGLKVTARYRNRVILDVEGAVPDIEGALHVTMRTYRHPAEEGYFMRRTGNRRWTWQRRSRTSGGWIITQRQSRMWN